MKLAVLNLTAGGISGGHRRFLEETLLRLASNPEIQAVLCVSPASMKTEQWIVPHPNIAFAECRPFSPLRASPDAALKKILDDFHPDIIFMAIERHLNYPGVPIVVMVQNMEPLVDLPANQGILEKLRRWARRLEAGRAVKRAAAIIAPTSFVKEALIQKFSIAPEKISVIHFGSVAPESEPMKPKTLTLPSPGGRGINTKPHPSPLLNRERGDAQFIFTAGSMEHYRGIEDLIDALAILKTKMQGLKLVIAGDARPGAEGYWRGLKERARTRGVSEEIIWLGNLNSREMSWCYLNCAAFAITSRVESFCMVALEALSHGCLCVSTDSPCLPEVLGPEINYYRAGDGAALAQEISRILLLDEAARQAMSESAVCRAQSFSWDKSAGLIVELFKRCR